MTKKEKIIYSFISNIIDDENPENIHLLTSTDVSNLMKRIEKTNSKAISISPEFIDDSNEVYDLYIVLDDVHVDETNIGRVKNLLSQKIVIFNDFNNDKDIDTQMLKLGLQAEFRDKTNNLKCFSYNLKNYNNKRTWNNSKGWANPENFDKFRW